MLLETLMPRYRFAEVHTVAVDAEADAVFGALRAIATEDLPVTRALMTLRGLPALMIRRTQPFRASHGSLLEEAVRAGSMILGDQENELVVGLIAQPWKLFGNDRTIRLEAVDDFMSFDRRDFVKIATNFLFDDNVRPAQLRTETRIWVADRVTGSKFAVYWLVIRPGSGLIRREWLRKIKHRAEGES